MASLLGPLIDEEPSQATGLNSHFASTYTAPKPVAANPSTPPRSSLGSNNPFRDNDEAVHRSPPSKAGVTTNERSLGRGSPRGSPRFAPHREAALGGLDSSHRRAASNASHDAAIASGPNSPTTKTSHHRRASSLAERYPGDDSHKPLDIIRRDSKKADRSPHLKRRHQPGADLIDRLDPGVGGKTYHHEGPFDAALLARNSSYDSSPIAALKTSNEETIKATPEEKVRDAIEKHKPLEGVADIPSGQMDRFGRTYNYEEGADLQHEPTEDGPGLGRWGGQDYHPEDLKGKGEPHFSLDRAMRAHKIDDVDGIEMEERAASLGIQTSSGSGDRVAAVSGSNAAGDIKRTGSLRAAGENLKKRIGSLRRKKNDE